MIKIDIFNENLIHHYMREIIFVRGADEALKTIPLVYF